MSIDQAGGDEGKSFDYSFSENGAYLVVSFFGIISKGAADAIESCSASVLARDKKFVILNLQSVEKIEIGGLPAFVRLQKTVRDRGALLRVCGAQRAPAEFLRQYGAIREEEFFKGLRETLEALRQIQAGG